MIRLRKPLLRFARHQEEVLRQNDFKTGWKHSERLSLLNRVFQEWLELRDEMMKGSQGSNEKIIKECCDVANFAMMIADNHEE